MIDMVLDERCRLDSVLEATTSGGGTANWFYQSIHFCMVMIGYGWKVKILKSRKVYVGYPT
jgi:hypothetical protein